MPHLHLEYTRNLTGLEPEKLLLKLNHSLMASGQFAHEVDIKARAVQLDHFRVGIGLGERAFVYVKLAILSGRSAEVKRKLSEGLLGALQEGISAPPGLDLQLGVDIVDMDREAYVKWRSQP
ncbi:5-carboxymethyl-2-hydroxymuconate Delta-isomerase [Pseudomonas japonica]|uniref:5-carboxymethyl-2-hydroxymuconate Delta-isomerase n=1 Tax=Pseudomonas japonica TaxID=256466 RepID=UPI0015E2FB07|nr:5-carboxymethyl-2-hydroxymuconate Delta-isomerase [Pseudomonas japonica]MBA1241856.1 5-carboxymethyl-2-hydroxymuconate Delta-isomerase [Pseudomonas japonica]MBA1288883.1 5-carboxymethyl-2-hydroxymuconate Delta-isomerase [Pseudomonas japonica]